MVSYKCIYINTYNVFVSDLSNDDENNIYMICRHEAFQIWESEVNGLLLQRNKDFVSCSKFGMNVIALGSTDKRRLTDNEGQ